MFAIDRQTLREGRNSLERAAALHLYDPNVSHIDLGFRIKSSQNNRLENELAVRVHLRKKLTGDAFAAFAEKFPQRVIDERTIGFPVDIPEADYRLQYTMTWGPILRPREARAQHFDTLRGGISISSAWSYGYGTLGGMVKDRYTGDLMLLSNWHVLAGSWFARPGLTVLQPGVGDGGTARDIVAVFERDAMRRQIDAAVAKLNGKRTAINEQLELGPVLGVASPGLGMVVTKSGRKSEITTGVITGIAGQTVQRYHGFRRIIRNVVHIAQINGSGEISAPGDSGSLWLERDTRLAAALHFAGSNTPEFGLALALPNVLDALHVDMAKTE